MSHDTTTKNPLKSAPCKGISGDATVAGDKSISHRALMLSSQVLGTTEIYGLLEGEDVLATARALSQLGVEITRGNPWRVRGVGVGGLRESADVLDMGNSGTSTRLLMGLLTPYPFASFFTGDASLRKRPMARVSEPLSLMGAQCVARAGGRLPLALQGTSSPIPIRYTMPVASAQVKSAILLAALNTPGITRVIEPEATRDHSERMLAALGFAIERKGNEISLSGQQKQTMAERRIDVPADPSSAAFLVVAALLVPNSKLLIRNVCINPSRTGLFTTLEEMGASLEYQNQREMSGEPVADLAVKTSTLKGVTVPAHRAPSMIDEYPILAVAAAFAEGQTRMLGLSELRVKESDRLNAVALALCACGVDAQVEGDDLLVNGVRKPRGGAEIKTYFDHRLAMSFLVIGMASELPVSVDDATAIATSFPNFVSLMNELGAHIQAPQQATQRVHPFVIAVDGPAASGKGTLARRLAEHFEMDYLDTGSLYRAVGMKLIYNGKDPSDREAALHAARTIDAEDLANPRLRQERVGQAASVISAYPEVRQELLEFQRKFATSPRGAVLDGRDIGTVVCPDATFKLFLTATLYARARRRHKELEGQGVEVVFDSVLDDLRERDERDEKRSVAPLKPASDAILLDTSDLDASEVFDKVCAVVQKQRKNAA